MTMKKDSTAPPLPMTELETLAAHYDAHDTASDMEQGEWVDPRPMKTTSLRLPSEVVEALKALAQKQGVRYTTLVREIIEKSLVGRRAADSEELAEINERLARIEAAVVDQGAQQTERAGRKKAATKKPAKRSQTARRRGKEEGVRA